MKLTIDFSDFHLWSGAVDAWEKIEAAGKLEDLEAVLEDCYPDGMSDAELNDLLWFEPEIVFDWLGIKTDEEEEEEEEYDRFCDHFSSCDFCPLRHEPTVKDCNSRITGFNHDKLFACIDGQERDTYDESILDD